MLLSRAVVACDFAYCLLAEPLVARAALGFLAKFAFDVLQNTRGRLLFERRLLFEKFVSVLLNSALDCQLSTDILPSDLHSKCTLFTSEAANMLLNQTLGSFPRCQASAWRWLPSTAPRAYQLVSISCLAVSFSPFILTDFSMLQR